MVMKRTNNFQQVNRNNHGIAASVVPENGRDLKGQIQKVNSNSVNDRPSYRLIPIGVADSEDQPVLIQVSTNIRRKTEV